MLSNQADYNQSDQDTEAEYTAVINLSGEQPYPGPELFKGWITLSTGQDNISVKINHAIHWIVIYQVDSIIHLSNNLGLLFKVKCHTKVLGYYNIAIFCL